jgi:hypothetical protein
MIGDAIHNLRAALDIIAWTIVYAGGKDDPNRSSFPLYGENAPRSSPQYELGALDAREGPPAQVLRYARVCVDPCCPVPLRPAFQPLSRHTLPSPCYPLWSGLVWVQRWVPDLV